MTGRRPGGTHTACGGSPFFQTAAAAGTRAQRSLRPRFYVHRSGGGTAGAKSGGEKSDKARRRKKKRQAKSRKTSGKQPQWKRQDRRKRKTGMRKSGHTLRRGKKAAARLVKRRKMCYNTDSMTGRCGRRIAKARKRNRRRNRRTARGMPGRQTLRDGLFRTDAAKADAFRLPDGHRPGSVPGGGFSFSASCFLLV